jgi:hypothetical protein
MNGEKQALFASAVASYRAHDQKKVAFGNTDFPNLVNRFGPGMPPKLALEAIDEILSKSKNDAQDGGDFSISVGGSEGSATFKSRYEYNLFILLPLLRQLDETRAQQLLEEDAPLKITATQYPKGMESISPTPVSAPDAKEAKPAQGASFRITRGDGGGDRMSSEAAMRDEMRRRTDMILKMAETDSTQAVARLGRRHVVMLSSRSRANRPRRIPRARESRWPSCAK